MGLLADLPQPVLTPLPVRVAHQPVRTPLPPLDDIGVRIVSRVALREAPDGPVVARLGPKTQFGSQRVLPVVHRRGNWLGVIATEMPNGKVGWIRAGGLRFVRVPVRLKVSLSERRL